MHKKDPLSVFHITLKSYEYVFNYLKRFNKVIYLLEGGYNDRVIYNGINKLLKIYGQVLFRDFQYHHFKQREITITMIGIILLKRESYQK